MAQRQERKRDRFACSRKTQSEGRNSTPAHVLVFPVCWWGGCFGRPGMSGGWYCPDCGATYTQLPVGAVHCRRCNNLGLRGFDRRPKRVTCPDHPDWRGWDDGGVNDDLPRHVRRDHADGVR